MMRERFIIGLLLSILIGFNACKKTCNPGDTNILSSLIENAQELHDNTLAADYLFDAKQELQAAILKAAVIRDEECTSQTELDNASNLLYESVISFLTKKDREEIEQYAKENNLNGQFTESGLYYIIIDEGNGKHPISGSTITVSYKGYFLDGIVFDEGDFFTANINNLIIGWQEGIPLIGEGGKIKLIIPSHLGYNDGVRVFDVSLHYFSK